MPSIPLSIPYDADAWIHVPLDYEGTRWRDAEEWAEWVAEAATHGREGGAAIAEAVRTEALETARFPAAHVTARFWHFPVDGHPSGMLDVFVQQRVPDGSQAADLLPETGFTLVDPVVEQLTADGFDTAVRRLTLNAVLPSDDAEPALLPKAEWLGIAGQWVAYLVTADHDVAQLRARLDDGDALFAALDLTREQARG